MARRSSPIPPPSDFPIPCGVALPLGATPRVPPGLPPRRPRGAAPGPVAPRVLPPPGASFREPLIPPMPRAHGALPGMRRGVPIPPRIFDVPVEEAPVPPPPAEPRALLPAPRPRQVLPAAPPVPRRLGAGTPEPRARVVASPDARAGRPRSHYTREEFQDYLAGQMLAAGLGMGRSEAVAKMARTLADAVLQGQWTDFLRPSNSNFRRLFQEVTGVKLPKTEKGTRALFDGRQFPATIHGLPVAPEPQIVARYPVTLAALVRAPLVTTANGVNAVVLDWKHAPVPVDGAFVAADGSVDVHDAKVALWRMALASPARVPFDPIPSSNLEMLRDIFQQKTTVTILYMGPDDTFPRHGTWTVTEPAMFTTNGDLRMTVRVAGVRGARSFVLPRDGLGDVYVWLGDVTIVAPSLRTMFDRALLAQSAASVPDVPLVHRALDAPAMPLFRAEWQQMRAGERVLPPQESTLSPASTPSPASPLPPPTPALLKSFLATFPPMQRGRVQATLTGLFRSRQWGVTPLHVLVENLIAEGRQVEPWRVRDTKTEDALRKRLDRMRPTVPFGNDQHPDTQRFRELQRQLDEGLFQDTRRLVDPGGAFFDEDGLTKTGMDYAEFLLATPRAS